VISQNMPIFHGPAQTDKSWTSLKISLATLCGERVLLLYNVPVHNAKLPITHGKLPNWD